MSYFGDIIIGFLVILFGSAIVIAIGMAAIAIKRLFY